MTQVDPVPRAPARTTRRDMRAGALDWGDDTTVEFTDAREDSILTGYGDRTDVDIVQSSTRVSFRDAPTRLTPSFASTHPDHRATRPRLRPNDVNDVNDNDVRDRPTLTATALRRSSWTRTVNHARQSLATRRGEREALARVIALAKPRTTAPRQRMRPTSVRVRGPSQSES